ncbi:hypothetical protein GCWU000341_00508 [Oribacterium sp. oral taxon 078 str. F0262]|nr:hypothetical protein GCWU000341_00508 [Oribacterium sp. oral taxon 078 str. F0262]
MNANAKRKIPHNFRSMRKNPHKISFLIQYPAYTPSYSSLSRL